MPDQKPNAGLWCSVFNNKDYLGGASTINGNVKSPIFPNARFDGKNYPVMPFSWIPYHFEINIDKDPTKVMIGMYVSQNRAWFDDIKININGKPLTDLAFQILKD